MSERRWLWAVPGIVFLATFGVFGVRHPGSIKAMLGNAQGVSLIVVAVLATAIFVWASRFRPTIQPFVPLVIAAGVLGAAIYAEVPFERRSTQNEMLVNELVVDASTPATTPTPKEVAAPTATRHANGQLRGINHTGSGSVSIIESAGGQWVVRFAEFNVQSSPAPVLYVINKADARSPGGTNLGAFTATNGDLLDVALPEGVRPSGGWTVLIWCEKFDTPIANASLQ